MKNGNILLVIGSGILITVGILFIGLTTAADESNREQARKRIELRQSSSTITTTEQLTFYIDDRTLACSEEKELIYEDSEARYYLPCYKSDTIYLVYSDNHEVTLRNALDSKLISIDELIKKGLEVIKETV